MKRGVSSTLLEQTHILIVAAPALCRNFECPTVRTQEFPGVYGTSGNRTSFRHCLSRDRGSAHFGPTCLCNRADLDVGAEHPPVVGERRADVVFGLEDSSDDHSVVAGVDEVARIARHPPAYIG